MPSPRCASVLWSSLRCLCVQRMSPCRAVALWRAFPLYAALPRSEYYARLRLLRERPPPSGWPFRRRTPRGGAREDSHRSPRFHGASLAARAVLSDPAGVSGRPRLVGRPTVAFQVFDPVGPRTIVTRLHRFTCVTARASLCLRFAHVVTSTSARLDSRWGGSPLAGAGIAPAGSARLALAHRSKP